MVHVFLTTSQHPLYCGTCFVNYQSTTLVLWYMFSQLPLNIPCIVVHVFLTTSQHPLYCRHPLYIFSQLPVFLTTILCIVNILCTSSRHFNILCIAVLYWYMFSQLPVNIPCIVVHVFLTTIQQPLYCCTNILNHQSTSFLLWYMFS